MNIENYINMNLYVYRLQRNYLKFPLNFWYKIDSIFFYLVKEKSKKL